MEKTCSRCKEHPLARGHKNWCRPCLNAYQRARNASHWGPRYKRYGLTKSDVAAMLAAQGNTCPVCFAPDPTDVDHCHATGKVRGILCGPCNRALGQAKDDPARLRALARYLEGAE